MRVGNFSLLVPEGRERDSGHVELPHGQVYKLKLMNHTRDRRCDAQVMVDGKEVGCFRVSKGGWVEIERPVNDQGKFTFFKADSSEAEAAGAGKVDKDLRGLIQVVFKPEKKPVTRSILDNAVPTCRMGHMSPARGPGGQSQLMGWSSPDCAGDAQLRAFGPEQAEKTCGGIFPQNSAGVTGLTGHSSQTFYEVPNLDYDTSQEVTISVRLVCCNEVRPLESIVKNNPVPAAVE